LIHSLPVPVPAAGEVLIATNTAVGARIRRFSVGDAVYAAGFPNPLEGGGHQRWGWSSGFYAECVAVSADGVAHWPKGLDLEHAGAMMPGLTALQGIDDALELRRGEAVVIHSASGGVDAVLALAGGPAGRARCVGGEPVHQQRVGQAAARVGLAARHRSVPRRPSLAG
jgi:NADPH-dependent curcumin reductase CurA